MIPYADAPFVSLTWLLRDPPDPCLLLAIYSYTFDYNRRSGSLEGLSLAGFSAPDPLFLRQVFGPWLEFDKRADLLSFRHSGGMTEIRSLEALYLASKRHESRAGSPHNDGMLTDLRALLREIRTEMCAVRLS